MPYRKFNIGNYERKTKLGKKIEVEGYTQYRAMDRGVPKQYTREKPTSHTYWLKDDMGRFVGRANSKGKTKAKGYVMARKDSTGIMQEVGSVGRIYGRSKSKSI